MTLSDIRDWLESLDVADHYHIGRINNKKEKSLGVYSRPRSGAPVTGIGDTSTYDIKGITLLLHWNRNARETEEAALKLWKKLINATGIDIGDEGAVVDGDGRRILDEDGDDIKALTTASGRRIERIYYARLMVPEPVPVGTDENGIYEYAIQMNVYYRR